MTESTLSRTIRNATPAGAPLACLTIPRDAAPEDPRAKPPRNAIGGRLSDKLIAAVEPDADRSGVADLAGPTR